MVPHVRQWIIPTSKQQPVLQQDLKETQTGKVELAEISKRGPANFEVQQEHSVPAMWCIYALQIPLSGGRGTVK